MQEKKKIFFKIFKLRKDYDYHATERKGYD